MKLFWPSSVHDVFSIALMQEVLLSNAAKMSSPQASAHQKLAHSHCSLPATGSAIPQQQKSITENTEQGMVLPQCNAHDSDMIDTFCSIAGSIPVSWIKQEDKDKAEGTVEAHSHYHELEDGHELDDCDDPSTKTSSVSYNAGFYDKDISSLQL